MYLYEHLAKGRDKRQKHHARTGRKTHIPKRISIHTRSKDIDNRTTYGHWESDSMVFSRQKQRISVQYERKAKYVVIHRLSD